MHLSEHLPLYSRGHKALPATEHNEPEGCYWPNKSVLYRINLGMFTLNSSNGQSKNNEANLVTTGWQYICSMFTLYGSCMPDCLPAQFALLPQMQMTEALMIFFHIDLTAGS